MPKPAHSRVTFEGVVGTVAAPLERFAFGVNFPAEALSASANNTVPDQIAASCKDAYNTGYAPTMPADVILTRVKVSRIDADGKVVRRGNGSFDQGVWEGAVAGAGAVQAVPLQTALCISLTSARAGATGKGRFFLPWPARAIVPADKRISVVDASAMADRSKTFLNGLATVMTFSPQIVSSKGYLTAVTGIKIGRVPDTMRSRREDSPEGYFALPLA